MLTSSDPVIGVIVGSAREGSLNQQLADQVAELSDHTLAFITGIDALPFFSPELEADLPAVVTSLRQAVNDVDALLVVAPEYNDGMPGMLKNALDWLSRPRPGAVLGGLPSAVIGASPSPGGAAGAAGDALRVLRRAGATPIGEPVNVPKAHEVLATPLKAELVERLTGLVDELASAARASSAAA